MKRKRSFLFCEFPKYSTVNRTDLLLYTVQKYKNKQKKAQKNNSNNNRNNITLFILRTPYVRLHSLTLS